LFSKVTFKIVGKEVHPSRLGNKFRKAAAGPGTLAKIEAVHCTVHDQNAKAVLNSTAKGEFSYEIQGCCNELIEAVKRQLAA
jgi:hypothetical protein